jgi:hypothetical protein
VEKIDHPSLLGWVVQKKKNSQTIVGYLPCGVRANHDERMDIQQKFEKHHELIQYIGVNYKSSGVLERVTQNNLLPYYGQEEDRTKWSPKLLQIHLESLRTRPEFQENTELKLRVEELALQYMLDEVLAKQEMKKSQAATAAASKAAETENVPPKISLAQWNSPPRGSPKPTPQHVPFAAALEKRPKQKLRAGDVIEYFHPVMVKDKYKAVIVKVNPPRSNSYFPLEMNDSTLLPSNCYVKLVLRRLNNKLQEPHDMRAFFEEISDFQLDSSQNDKVQFVTKADQLGQAHRKMQNDLRDCQDEYWRDNAKQKDATENVKDDDTAGEYEPSTPERSSKLAAAPLPVAQQPATKPSSKASQKSAVSKAQPKSRPPRRPIARSPKTKAPPKETKAAWIDEMEDLLADSRKKRSVRCDQYEVNPKEEALKVAIQARLKLEDEGRREKNREGELLDELEGVFGVPIERLRGFLHGNRNNLIKVGDLIELTDKWKTWLSSGSTQGAVADKESIEGASARIDATIEDAAAVNMRVEDATVPSLGLEPSAQRESAPGGTRASDNAATGGETIEGVTSPIDCSEPSAQRESAPGGTRASDNAATGGETIEGVTSPIDGSEPSAQQESASGGTRASDHVATGEEPIEGATSPIDGSEPSTQQESASGGTTARDHVATGEEPIEGATSPIDGESTPPSPKKKQRLD